ncbi:hypothetical protein Bca4012_043467 [Brassica carinata]
MSVIIIKPYAQLRLIEYAYLSYKYYTLLLLFGVSRKEICSQSHVNMNMHKGTWTFSFAPKIYISEVN